MWSTLLGFVTGNKTTIYIVAGVALAGLIGWLFWARASLQSEVSELTKEMGRIEEQRDQAVAVAAKNAKALVDYRKAAEASLAAVVAERDAAQQRKEQVRVIVREIESAPPEADGPAADVLVDAVRLVDGLRERAGNDTGHGDETRTR